MSVVNDLRQVIQDLVSPDLKSVSAGVAAIREEVSHLRAEIAAAEKRGTERLEKSELRALEKLDRIYDAVKIADLSRRNTELETELEQMRRARQADPQQH